LISISLIEPRTVAWKDWRSRSQDAQVALNQTYASGSSWKVSEKLYREQKEFFLGLNGPFHGKCAYCETLIAANHPGDIDHFRPKSRVTVNSTIVNVMDGRRRSVPHPGYYWLTYDYLNLLPACENCNRPSKGRSGGRLIGKWDNFPVKRFRARFPGEEKKERTLLINPTRKECRIDRHLSFDASGIVKSLSEVGTTCCDIFGFNAREGLVKERRAAYQTGHDAVLSYFLALAFENAAGASTHLKTINEYEAGIKPYSAAGRVGIDAQLKKIRTGKYSVTSKPAVHK
jgi:hypothetical protein